MSNKGIDSTINWFKQAIPEPTIEQASIQVGCHYEEVSEMMGALLDEEYSISSSSIANEYKTCRSYHIEFLLDLTENEKVELLDSLADQIVTATGVAHTLGMDIQGALEEVNRSNFSKFENGKPVFDKNGKITKGKHYTPPDLSKFI